MLWTEIEVLRFPVFQCSYGSQHGGSIWEAVVERGVRKSWVPASYLTRPLTGDTYLPSPLCCPISSQGQVHSVLQPGMVKCHGRDSITPLVAKGRRPPEEILGRGTEPGRPRGWVASSPPARPTENLGFCLTWLLVPCLVCRAGSLSCCLCHRPLVHT